MAVLPLLKKATQDAIRVSRQRGKRQMRKDAKGEEMLAAKYGLTMPDREFMAENRIYYKGLTLT